jgi:hypothetical protein
MGRHQYDVGVVGWARGLYPFGQAVVKIGECDPRSVCSRCERSRVVGQGDQSDADLAALKVLWSFREGLVCTGAGSAYPRLPQVVDGV